MLDNLLKDYVGTHYEYDERGNLIKRTHNGEVTTFLWDNFNRMVQSTSKEVQTHYSYDALGRRIVKHSQPIVHVPGGAGSGYLATQKQTIARKHNLGLTLYGWEGDTLAWESSYGSRNRINETTGQIEAAFDSSQTTHYIYEPNSFVPMIQAKSTGSIELLKTPDYKAIANSEQGYDIDQDPVWQYQPERAVKPFDAIAFYQCDHLGTPQELTDMNGEIAWAAEYKAWGLAYEAMSKAGKAAGLKQPIRFQGQYFDHETGLHYNRHRYYDPHSGRFVSKDPIGLRGGINLHGYVSNPNMQIDILGLSGCTIGAAIGMGIGVVAAGAGDVATGGINIPANPQEVAAAGVIGCAAGTAIDNTVEAIRKYKSKCMAPTIGNVRAVCMESNVFTLQKSVSLPKIAGQVAMIEAGSVAPPVQMDGNVIIDGNHRYISALLCGQLPSRIEWTAPLSKPRLPLATILIDLKPWD